MYHIVKTKSKKQPFQVVLVGKNGELLSSSELFASKATAFKNIKAQLKISYGRSLVQDDTLDVNKKIPVFYLSGEYKYNKILAKVNPSPRFVAGKNPSTKKKTK